MPTILSIGCREWLFFLLWVFFFCFWFYMSKETEAPRGQAVSWDHEEAEYGHLPDVTLTLFPPSRGVTFAFHRLRRLGAEYFNTHARI